MIEGMTTLTTMKVPVELREQIAAEARAQRKTVAGFLSTLLDKYRKEQRFEDLKQAIAAQPMDDNYWNEYEAFASMSMVPDE